MHVRGTSKNTYNQISGPNGDYRAFMLMAYPVGSVYLSVGNIEPSILFGGEWEQLPDDYYLCTASSDLKNTFGNNVSGDTSLTVAQIPSHNHIFTGSAITSGSTTPGATGSAGNHYHINFYSPNASGSSWQLRGTTGQNVNADAIDGGAITGRTNDAGAHTHGSAAHTHSVTASGTISSTGSGSSHNHTINPKGIKIAAWIRIA